MTTTAETLKREIKKSKGTKGTDGALSIAGEEKEASLLPPTYSGFSQQGFSGLTVVVYFIQRWGEPTWVLSDITPSCTRKKTEEGYINNYIILIYIYTDSTSKLCFFFRRVYRIRRATASG